MRSRRDAGNHDGPLRRECDRGGLQVVQRRARPPDSRRECLSAGNEQARAGEDRAGGSGIRTGRDQGPGHAEAHLLRSPAQMTAWHSVAAQVARMRQVAPYMQETARCDWLAVWTGPLRPLQRTYTVTIIYVARLRLGDAEVIGAFRPAVRL